MPIYDFVCADCSECFEELVKSSSDSAGVSCSKCGSARVERQLGVFAAGTSRQGAGRPSAAPAVPRASGGG